MATKNQQKSVIPDQSTIFGLELGINIDKRVLRVAGMVVVEFVVLLAAGYFLIVPRINAINQLNNSLELQQTQLNNMNQKLRVLTEFEASQARYDTVLKGAMPVSKDVGLVLASLRSLALESEIEVVSYSVDPVVVDEERQQAAFGTGGERQTTRTESFRMDLTIAGQSAQVQRFLELVDQSLPIKVIEDMVITSGDVADVANFLEMRVEIRSYFLPLTQRANPSGLLRVLSAAEMELVEEMLSYRSLPLTAEGTLTETVPIGNQDLFGVSGNATPGAGL